MSRDDKVIIRLTDDVKADFKSVAEELGLTMSGLGGYIIGKFVSDHRIEAEAKKKAAMKKFTDENSLEKTS